MESQIKRSKSHTIHPSTEFGRTRTSEAKQGQGGGEETREEGDREEGDREERKEAERRRQRERRQGGKTRERQGDGEGETGRETGRETREGRSVIHQGSVEA
jgi:hypothetical protein